MQSVEKNGFTLVEVMISLFIFILIISNIYVILSLVKKNSHSIDIETEIFFQQLGIDVRKTEEISIMKGSLFLKQFNGRVVSYDLYGNILRRRVDGQGYEPTLLQVKSVEFKNINNGVSIYVKKLQGEEYLKKISMISHHLLKGLPDEDVEENA